MKLFLIILFLASNLNANSPAFFVHPNGDKYESYWRMAIRPFPRVEINWNEYPIFKKIPMPRPRNWTDIDSFRRTMIKASKSVAIPEMDKIATYYYFYSTKCCAPSRASTLYKHHKTYAWKQFNNDPSKSDDVERLHLASMLCYQLFFYAQDNERVIQEFAVKFWGRNRLRDYKVDWNYEEHIKSHSLTEVRKRISRQNGKIYIDGKDLDLVHKSLLTDDYVYWNKIPIKTLPQLRVDKRGNLQYNQ